MGVLFVSLGTLAFHLLPLILLSFDLSLLLVGQQSRLLTHEETVAKLAAFETAGGHAGYLGVTVFSTAETLTARSSLSLVIVAVVAKVFVAATVATHPGLVQT